MLSQSLLTSLRDIIFSLANLCISTLLLRHCTYVDSQDNFSIFVGWVERNEYVDEQKIKDIHTRLGEEGKDLASILYKDFQKL